MSIRRAVLALALVLAGAVGAWVLWRDGTGEHFTGFVEGEERIVRSEVTGRILAVPYGEGDAVPAGAVVARLEDDDVRTRIDAKKRELDVQEADIRAQEERVGLVEQTWQRDVLARRAELAQARSAARLAERTFAREQELVATGASTAQLLDEARARRDQAQSGLTRARELLARTEAEEGNVAVARQTLDAMRERRELLAAQLVELEVLRAKYEVRAPAVATVLQTQHVWPGELAQPGAPIVSVLDPRDKYVQVYVPVARLDEFRIGRAAELELDSEPGRRYPGEVVFVADRATFTPEKIETRSDRLGQVYRAKVRIREGVERLRPGTEGNVYLVDGAAGDPAAGE